MTATFDRLMAFLDEAIEGIEMTEYGENVYDECPNCGGHHGMDNCDSDEGD